MSETEVRNRVSGSGGRIADKAKYVRNKCRYWYLPNGVGVIKVTTGDVAPTEEDKCAHYLYYSILQKCKKYIPAHTERQSKLDLENRNRCI